MLLVVSSQQAGPRELLHGLLVELLGSAPHVDRSCPDCAEQHGKPLLDHPSLHVSTSDSWGLALVAVTDAGPVGVDVEKADAARFAGFDGVALAPGETGDPARLWTRKEAVLKATGEGLRTDPTTVPVTGDREPVRGAELYDVPVPEGWVASLAVVTDERPVLEVR